MGAQVRIRTGKKNIKGARDSLVSLPFDVFRGSPEQSYHRHSRALQCVIVLNTTSGLSHHLKFLPNVAF